MTQQRSLIAKRYAQAFLNVFIDSIALDDFHNICAAEQFLMQHKQALFLLKLPFINPAKKKEILNELCQKFRLIDKFKELVELLVHDKRSFLLPDVLYYVSKLYQQRKGIMSFTIISSHRLGTDKLNSMQRFLAQESGCDIIYNYRVDKKLIAGIRLYSDTLLWEYSINKQLRNAYIAFIR